MDSGSRLHLYVDGRDQGVAAGGIPQPCYVLIDLYGQCQQVGVIGSCRALMGSYGVVVGSYGVVMGSLWGRYGVVMGCGIVGIWDMEVPQSWSTCMGSASRWAL